jgi:SAM-dependent methyltransferase
MLVDLLHTKHVHPRRLRVLRDHFLQLLPTSGSVLDIGCGDGLLAHMIMQQRSEIQITGIDVVVRSGTRIPIESFDGGVIPYADASFDVVTLVDVLHHSDDPMSLLVEAVRVSRSTVIIKDHTRDGLFADFTLRFMDRVGNERHGVNIPYNYWSREQWLTAFAKLNLTVASWNKNLKLYPIPAGWVFDRSLHFIARLEHAA